MLDFDNFETWGPQLTDAFGGLASKSVLNRLVTAKPEFVEDALNLFFTLTDRDKVIDATLAYIQSTTVAGYHGSRLTDSDVNSIQTQGLLPLDANARRQRLYRALSSHPRWNGVANNLDPLLLQYGKEGKGGCREGQVHLTLSRSGLVNGFNRYLLYGAEFDQHVAHALLGEEGKECLRHDGESKIIRVAVPGDIALDTTNRYFTIEICQARGDIPNLVNELLQAWAYKLAYPDFNCEALQIDCGMVFHSAVPCAWILDVETWAVQKV